jgi:hypothetical protein
MSADGRAADSPQQESPQQGIQSIEVGAQVLRAFGPDRGLVLAIGLAMPARLLVEGHGGEADGLADALSSTAGQISAELGYSPA